jgi:hypothetical protein
VLRLLQAPCHLAERTNLVLPQQDRLNFFNTAGGAAGVTKRDHERPTHSAASRPILALSISVNQIAPSGPTTIW